MPAITGWFAKFYVLVSRGNMKFYEFYKIRIRIICDTISNCKKKKFRKWKFQITFYLEFFARFLIKNIFSNVHISDVIQNFAFLLLKAVMKIIVINVSTIGGWSFGTQKFKDMSATRYTRQTFIYSAVPYLRSRNFDGLDIDWEYPKGNDDKKNFVLLLKGW